MERVPNPMEALPPTPAVSVQTVHMAGLLVDVYGLDELAPTARRVSCLWLHHPRMCAKKDMADIATRCVGAWNRSAANAVSGRGLIALAFDQRNHGTRAAHPPANAAWSGGNATHAQDMFGIVAGMVADQVGLLDAVAGYLFLDDDGHSSRVIDQHLGLGISLGGHSIWQLMFADPRVCAGVCVIGCPDFMYLLQDRARLSKLSTYSAADEGASFLGSRSFPPALVAACRKSDPKAILFGTGAVAASLSQSGSGTDEGADDETRCVLRERVAGKKFLVCSGGDDKLVPYRCSKPFMDWFKGAAEAWFPGDGRESLYVEDNVYDGVGHAFAADMVRDAVRFVVDVVAGAGKGQAGEDTTAKI